MGWATPIQMSASTIIPKGVCGATYSGCNLHLTSIADWDGTGVYEIYIAGTLGGMQNVESRYGNTVSSLDRATTESGFSGAGRHAYIIYTRGPEYA